MMRYIKLVNFELGRFLKIYLVLVGLTLVLQLLGVFLEANGYLGEVEELVVNGNLTQEQFLHDYGYFSFNDVSRSGWFIVPILFCILTLMIYVFFIWYRDWVGKNTFAYRLLMLPTARINVFYAKATAIFLMVLGLVSLQLVYLPIENSVLRMMVPSDFRIDMTVDQILNGFDNLRVIFPTSLIQFIINYGIGFTAVFVLFTAILFERSFRWKGIILGLIFGAVAVVVFISPILVQAFVLPEFFYPMELFILVVITGLIVLAGTIWTSNFLLNKKIRV
ncbi:hypothetical protein [Ornithinibacillus xuwenensis]|uniref:Uncharacterized protein n=1 Tax=Ornithinibacillus xuwenensis TaxID=3144668 RepID=A0ABU9XPP7_9BACI